MVTARLQTCTVLIVLGCVVVVCGADVGDGQFAVDSFFDVFTELGVAPGETLGVNLQGESLATARRVDVAALLLSAGNSTDVYLLGEVPGANAGASMNVEVTPPPPMGPDSFFDVFFDIEIPAESSGPPPQLVGRPVIVGDGFAVDSFFDVFFDIEIPTNEPDQQILSIKVHCEPAQQGVILRDLGLGGDPSMVDSFFDVFVEIEIPADSGFDPALPSVIMRFEGSFRATPSILPGDADIDGDVDLDDFVILKTNFGATNADWGDGDFDDDDDVDLDDFVILKTNFGAVSLP